MRACSVCRFRLPLEGVYLDGSNMGISAFQRFRLDIARYELLDEGRRVHLERQPMELLILLWQRRGELVTREEIAERLWPKGVHVDADASINRIVHKLRLVLHDDPEAPLFIETVVAKGYRFVGPIEILNPGAVCQPE